MKKITLKRIPYEKKDFVKRSALETDFKTLINEPTLIYDEENPDEVKIIYDVLNIETTDIVQALKRIKYTEGKRTRGLKSLSRIFGYKPRHEIRGNYCSSTSLATESPSEHSLICGLAGRIEAFYEKYYPEGYRKHLTLAEAEIKAEWRMNQKSAFTSGIINKNNPLKYHFDTGNFNDVYSMMIVFKEDVEGGFLSIPEYGIGIELKNNSILMFDGQSLMHGVTPIKYKSDKGHRFSIVFYSLKKMWKCLEIGEELKWARKKRSEKENMRANMTEEHKASLKARWGKQ